MEMVHLEVLTRAGHSRVADVGPGGLASTGGTPMLGHRVIAFPSFQGLAQATGHRAGGHRTPCPPAPSHCGGEKKGMRRKATSISPSAPRPLRWTAPK